MRLLLDTSPPGEAKKKTDKGTPRETRPIRANWIQRLESQGRNAQTAPAPPRPLTMLPLAAALAAVLAIAALVGLVIRPRNRKHGANRKGERSQGLFLGLIRLRAPGETRPFEGCARGRSVGPFRIVSDAQRALVARTERLSCRWTASRHALRVSTCERGACPGGWRLGRPRLNFARPRRCEQTELPREETRIEKRSGSGGPRSGETMERADISGLCGAAPGRGVARTWLKVAAGRFRSA